MRYHRIILLLSLVGLLIPGATWNALHRIGFLGVHAAQSQAQINPDSWTQPVNLSRSLAASQPRIVAVADGTIQVFWFDRFDGLMTSIFINQGWSKPSNIQLPQFPEVMPDLVADRFGWIHAFWQVDENDGTARSLLYHSQMPAGGLVWSSPELIAEDALVYSVFPSATGSLSLAYIRRASSDAFPAGVYFRSHPGGEGAWSQAAFVYKSIYYRLLTSGESSISTTDDGRGNFFIAWYDPFSRQTWISQSKNNGTFWSSPTNFGDTDNDSGQSLRPINPRLAGMPGAVIGIWQASAANQCALYQQEWINNEWSTPVQIFQGLESCPVSDKLTIDPENQKIYWMWGLGTSNLSLSIWDAISKQWSEAVSQTISFNDPTTNQIIILGGLDSAINGSLLAAVGIDANNDIWQTQLEGGAPELLYADSPPWSVPQPISDETKFAFDPDIAIDRQGNTYLVFVQSSSPDRVGADLLISQSQREAASPQSGGVNEPIQQNATLIFGGKPDEIVRYPQLLIDEQSGFLHLVWSGGKEGEIIYSRAPLALAGSPGEWFSTQPISTEAYATWPRIGMDAAQNLYCIYTIQFNEQRGIYLVKSNDRGQSWSFPEQIFNPATEGLQAVDHPALLVTPQGNLHLAWVETAPGGDGKPQGIFYTLSTDGGLSWSEPVILVSSGYDWPVLAISGKSLHLLYSDLPANGGNIWQRTTSLVAINSKTTEIWSPAVRVPSFSSIGWPGGLIPPGNGLLSPPFDVAVDGTPEEGSLHMIAVKNPTGDDFTTPGALIYSTWDNLGWSQAETVNFSQSSGFGLGVSAAIPPVGGVLAVSWLAESGNRVNSAPLLWYAKREIPSVREQILPTAEPTAAPIITPTPTITIYIPTPTPDLNNIPAPDNSQSSPLIIAGLIAGILVLGVLGYKVISSRRR